MTWSGRITKIEEDADGFVILTIKLDSPFLSDMYKQEEIDACYGFKIGTVKIIQKEEE